MLSGDLFWRGFPLVCFCTCIAPHSLRYPVWQCICLFSLYFSLKVKMFYFFQRFHTSMSVAPRRLENTPDIVQFLPYQAQYEYHTTATTAIVHLFLTWVFRKKECKKDTECPPSNENAAPSRLLCKKKETSPFPLLLRLLLLWFENAMSGQELRNHKMRHVFVGPIRHVTCDASEERNVKSLF